MQESNLAGDWYSTTLHSPDQFGQALSLGSYGKSIFVWTTFELLHEGVQSMLLFDVMKQRSS
jgi:hypothetical protein